MMSTRVGPTHSASNRRRVEEVLDRTGIEGVEEALTRTGVEGAEKALARISAKGQ